MIKNILLIIIGAILLASPGYLDMCYGMCWYDSLPILGFGLLISGVFVGIAEEDKLRIKETSRK